MLINKLIGASLIGALIGVGVFSTCKTPGTTSGSRAKSGGRVADESSSAYTGPESAFSLVGDPMKGVGPADPYHGFPRWYEDAR